VRDALKRTSAVPRYTLASVVTRRMRTNPEADVSTTGSDEASVPPPGSARLTCAALPLPTMVATISPLNPVARTGPLALPLRNWYVSFASRPAMRRVVRLSSA
jgi:hypothetical protein